MKQDEEPQEGELSWQKNQVYQEELEREEENARNQYARLKLKDIFPLNFIPQKENFFSRSMDYCPHFIYKTAVYPQPIKLNTEYEEVAYKILKNAPPYPTNIPYLNKQQVVSMVEDYLDNMGLKDFVKIEMEFECLSRTSVTMFKNKAILKIRTPLSYTRNNLQGVLHHEVATHILRTLNHRQNCLRKPSEKGRIIEEGLAVINQLLPEEKPVLFKPALRYVAAILSSKHSFKELYKKLNRYVPDRDECWRECVRVKRGMGSTEEHGGYYKDQNYLIGAITILQNRQNIDFQKIYFGKLTPEETKNMTVGVLPPFLGSPAKLKAYLKKMEIIALTNFID